MSRPPRFFISPDQVTGSSIIISGEDVRHAAVVLRMKPGEKILLCDGQGTEYTVEISSVERSAIVTRILEQSRRDLPSPRVTLGQGLPKSDKMDLIVQKATELGVASVVPLVTERTVVKMKEAEKRVVRWMKIAREAAMQSNRPDIPVVGQLRTYTDLLDGLSLFPDALFLLPWEEATEPLRNILRKSAGVRSVLVLIGPEGGFSSREAGMAREKGFHPVSLGRNILRTETAAIAALSMIGYELF